MRTRGKNLITAVAVITAGAAALYVTSKFIYAKAQKGQNDQKLGFSWKFVAHSADILDCSKQFRNELKWGI